MNPVRIRSCLSLLPVRASFTDWPYLSCVSIREIGVLVVTAVPQDRRVRHVATDSVDVCEVVRIAHIVQGHYPCYLFMLTTGE